MVLCQRFYVSKQLLKTNQSENYCNKSQELLVQYNWGKPSSMEKGMDRTPMCS